MIFNYTFNWYKICFSIADSIWSYSVISNNWKTFSNFVPFSKSPNFKKEFTIINFLLTFQVFESELQFVARYFSLWILRTRHSWNVGFEFQRFTKHWCLPIWQSEMACWPEGNYWNSNQISNTYFTLLGSGSEWPKDQALLLTMVSYFKN